MLRDRADSEADHRRFIERVIRAETVWALRADDGFAWCKSNDHEDQAVIMFWSDRAYAERARKSEFPEYTLVEISLFDFLFRWLPGMAGDGVLAGANWAGQLIGVESDPDGLQDQITDQMPKDMIGRYIRTLKNAIAEQDQPT
jgi:hypothetical protein